MFELSERLSRWTAQVREGGLWNSWQEEARTKKRSPSILPLINIVFSDDQLGIAEFVDDQLGIAEFVYGDDYPEELRALVESFVAHHLDDEDLCARFVVLSFLALLAVDFDEDDADDEWEAGTEKSPLYWKLFSDIVKLVDPEQLTDPEAIRWEIVNACAAEEWTVAEKLYDRLRYTAKMDEGEFRAIRGEFLFTVADWQHRDRAEHELVHNSLEWWYPTLEPGTFSAISRTLTIITSPHEQTSLADPLVVRYRDAANDLQSALQLGSSLSPHIHLVLGWSNWLSADYRTAGKQYEYVLGSGFGRSWPGSWPVEISELRIQLLQIGPIICTWYHSITPCISAITHL